jgi:hypothetical protein
MPNLDTHGIGQMVHRGAISGGRFQRLKGWVMSYLRVDQATPVAVTARLAAGLAAAKLAAKPVVAAAAKPVVAAAAKPVVAAAVKPVVAAAVKPAAKPVAAKPVAKPAAKFAKPAR